MHPTQYYPAIVEDRDDPLRLGRCRVRVFGVHSESLDDVPTQSLPWAIPLMPITQASLSGVGNSPTGVVPGTMVLVFFQDGESKQMPIMMGTIPGIPQSKNMGLSGGVLDESISLTGGFTPATNTSPQTGGLVQSDGTPVTSSDGTQVSTGTSSSIVIGKQASGMTMSQAATEIIIQYEGYRSKPYRDSVGIATIGYGTTIYPNGKRVTMDDVEASRDIAKGYLTHHVEKLVYPIIGSKVNVPITQSMFDSLVQFIYNIGGGAFGKQTLLKLLNSGDYVGASNEFLSWTKAGGRVLAGLVTRRNAEKALFLREGIPTNTGNPIEPEVVEPQAEIIQNTNAPTAQEISQVISTANTLGFKDSTGKYPLSGTLKEPDTNRLFRKVTVGTVVDKKNKNRRKKIKSFDSGIEFSEPVSPYNGTYPYNRGTFTESGHLIEYDDTPGSERIHQYHKSGTYTEIDVYGNQVNRIVGDGYTIIDRNGYLYIDGTARIIMGSDVKIAIGGNLDVQVAGDATYKIGGNLNNIVSGDYITNAGGKIHSRSASHTAIDGQYIFWDCDISTKNPEFKSSSPNNIDYAPQRPETNFDSEFITLEDSDNVDAYYESATRRGIIAPEELGGTTNSSGESDTTPPPTQQTLPKECGMFTDSVPSSTKISKYFTIGMLQSNAVVTKDTIQAQRGKTIAEIACNLKMLGENSLDKIREKYPNMMVTSGFRIGSGRSQHELGQAADIQFRGASKSEYFEIAKWIKDNVPFDQLLLEYKTVGTGMPWIHISYTESPRKQVFTYMNHKNQGSGLTDLSRA